MTKFEQIKNDIMLQLATVDYNGDIGDIGNEIGIE